MIKIRPLDESDKPHWLPLWYGYLTFYETKLAPEVTDNTWARLLSSGEGIEGLAAVNAAGEMVGFAHYLLHSGTWGAGDLCYLEDLFVAESARGLGAGRALIADLTAQGRAKGWKQVYWQTAASNRTAQALYDKLARRTDWVKYEIDL